MIKQVVFPDGMGGAGQLDLSPAVRSGDFLFVTGMTGSDPDGAMPQDPETQFRNAFAKIATILAECDRDLDAVVEMTTYHVGMQAHFDLFDRVRLDLMKAPHPAWTAIEVAGLRRPAALVEIRTVCNVA